MGVPPGRLGDSHLLTWPVLHSTLISTYDNWSKYEKSIQDALSLFFGYLGPYKPGSDGFKAANSFPIPVGRGNSRGTSPLERVHQPRSQYH